MAIKKYLFLIFFLTSCNKIAQNYYRESFEPNYKIHIRDVNIKLRDRIVWPISKSDKKFLSPDEVEIITKEEIIKKLQQDGLYSEKSGKNILECDFFINYDRMFMIFTNHGYIGTALRNYEVFIYKNGNMIAEKFEKNRQTANLKFDKKIVKIGKEITFNYDREEEIKEVKNLAQYLALDFEKFLVFFSSNNGNNLQ